MVHQPVSPDDALALARRLCGTIAHLFLIIGQHDWPTFKAPLTELYEIATRLTELVGVEADPKERRQIM
jgi:hypothetical protein